MEIQEKAWVNQTPGSWVQGWLLDMCHSSLAREMKLILLPQPGPDCICSLGQAGLSLSLTALATTASSMMDMEQVLGWRSPVKRLEPIKTSLKSICFDLRHILLRCQCKRLHFASRCVATRPLPLHININMVAMPMPDVLLRHFRKCSTDRWAHSYLLRMYSRQDRRRLTDEELGGCSVGIYKKHYEVTLTCTNVQ